MSWILNSNLILGILRDENETKIIAFESVLSFKDGLIPGSNLHTNKKFY